ncbi:hypothetical protein [uncultured Sphingomonas sp.]|uniref:hypothetical protein n=1 Tax=uncultured Sphingomonas sp. TaxID=158754 RepID=UPI0025DEAB5B|nr:hypothetical protein [uncultured Sphingomonas sp.]
MANVQPSIARRLFALALVPGLIGSLTGGSYAITAGPFDLSAFVFMTMIVAMPLIFLALCVGAPMIILTRRYAIRPIPTALAGALIVALPAALMMIRSEPVEGLRDGFYEMLSTHHPRGTHGWLAEIASEVANLAAIGFAGGVIYWVLCGGPWHRAHRDR